MINIWTDFYIAVGAKSIKNNSSKVSTTNLPQISHLIPVIGIGASAGGLEALEQFLGKVPPNIGMAFVIVQHLDPYYKQCLLAPAPI